MKHIKKYNRKPEIGDYVLCSENDKNDDDLKSMRYIKMYEELEQHSKFNIGDPVYCVNNRDSPLDSNTEYTITDVMTDDKAYYRISPSPRTDSKFWYSGSRFVSPDEYINLKYNL